MALGVMGLLHPEVRIDQQQRLRRQILRLQIPHRVVGGHMTDVRQPVAAEPQIRVIVVQIRHPLPRMAAELADVVSGGAAGYQRQIHRRAAAPQRPAAGQCDVMHPGDVLQRAVGRHLQPQPHHLIDVRPLPLPQHLSIAGAAGAIRRLCLR